MAVDGALTAGFWFVTSSCKGTPGAEPWQTGLAGRRVGVPPGPAARPTAAAADHRLRPCLPGLRRGLFVVDHVRFPDVGFPIALQAMSAHSRNDIMRRWALVVGALAGYVAGFSWRA